jgi:PadR family transcriptional regulator, regulatory protein PadR
VGFVACVGEHDGASGRGPWQNGAFGSYPGPRGRCPAPSDLLQGTLDLLILRTLLAGDLHGWGIAKRIEQRSGEVLSVGQGSLYPALYRLEERGWIESEWGRSAEGRRAKLYRLTAEGREQFAAERASWRLFSGAIEQVLGNA